MSRPARITLLVRTGPRGFSEEHSFSMTISSLLEQDLSRSLELTNEVNFAANEGRMTAPAYLEFREAYFKMRKEHATEISETIVKLMLDYFGRNDTEHGYSKDDVKRLREGTK